MPRSLWFAATVLLATLLTAGCGSSSRPSTGAASSTPPVTHPSPAPTSDPAGSDGIGRGRVIVLDPGHNGGNAAHPAEINRKVPDGRGAMKACNTTGTAAVDGYSEHAFNWDVAVRVREILSAKGFQVILTRPDDSGVGPCVDERAAIGNRVAAAAVVAIHADGAPGASARGFHVAYSWPPLNPTQSGPSIHLATTLRDALSAAGFTPSTYVGAAGLNPRADLSGLNLSTRPTALIECGNMFHPADAAVLESPQGRAHIATTIATGIMTYLG